MVFLLTLLFSIVSEYIFLILIIQRIWRLDQLWQKRKTIRIYKIFCLSTRFSTTNKFSGSEISMLCCSLVELYQNTHLIFYFSLSLLLTHTLSNKSWCILNFQHNAFSVSLHTVAVSARRHGEQILDHMRANLLEQIEKDEILQVDI